MDYQLLLLDIDGTLRPDGCARVPRENAEAVNAVQHAGVRIAIATGRGRTGVGKGLLRSIRPDYWLCAGGAQLLDRQGSDLELHRFTPEEMYALVDFFEDYELPLR
ncbi:MAG: HAD family hydrolase, partial [Blautia massiliensis (ex Durand et al. 2017)]